MAQLFTSLAKLGIALDWCILDVALSSDRDPQLISPAELQHYAAELLGAGTNDEVLPLAVLSPGDIEETRAVASDLAAQSNCDHQRALSVLFLVDVDRWASTHTASDSTAAISELVSLFAKQQSTATAPAAIQSWIDDTIDPATFWSADGFEALHTAIVGWIDGERVRLSCSE